MFRARFGFGGTVKNIVAWLGLSLMVASFVWWQILSIPRPAASVRHTAAPAPFTAAVTNRARDCIFVSIHFNEAKKVVSGVETYFAEHQAAPAPRLVSWIPFFQGPAAESPPLASQSLAQFIQEAMVARTKAPDRGTKAEQFFVIANVGVPAVLVEAGFLSNKEDIAKLESNDYREQMAAAISEGILRYRDVLKERQLPLAVTGPGTE